jgi:DNA-binding XRE family transcriptional regulator
MDELVQQQTAPQRPARYVVVTEVDGRRRVARADGLPLGAGRVGTPPPERPPVPAPTYEARKTAFLRGCLERGMPAAVRAAHTASTRRAADPAAPTGEDIKRRREALGLSQRDLAAAAGMSRGLLSEIEGGTRNAPESRLLFGNALTLRERNRPAEPVEHDGLPRAEAG